MKLEYTSNCIVVFPVNNYDEYLYQVWIKQRNHKIKKIKDKIEINKTNTIY